MGRVRLILELSIAILTSALAANPARIFVVDDGTSFCSSFFSLLRGYLPRRAMI